MKFSNTSLNTYASCQRKFWHNYVNHSSKCKPNPLYFAFGEMAHKVLKDAGDLRDGIEGGCEVNYDTVIPSELEYPELKREFRITNWHSYFVNVCKQVKEYEQAEINYMADENVGLSGIEIFREHEIVEIICGKQVIGIIDLLIISSNRQYATIIDYKFSSTQKTQDDFDMNSQLQLYATLVNRRYGVPLRNIRVGYIDIVRSDFERPIVLNNGTLSRAKSQNVSQEMYIACVKALNPDTWEELLAPGGYYYDIVQELVNRKIAYMNVQWLDMDTYNGVMRDVMITLDEVYDKLNKIPTSDMSNFCARYDAYTCKSCEFLTACKPWLAVKGE